MASPPLTAKTIANEQCLGTALDGLLHADEEHARYLRRIVRRQRALRQAASPKAWAIYMRLEEITSERLVHVTDIVAKWAFSEALKDGGRRP